MAKFNNKGFIIELEDNEVFVFGSNLNGNHAGGSAKQAYEDFGAIFGNGDGIQGIGHDFKSYAFPTLDTEMKKLPTENIKQSFDNLIKVANWCSEKIFYLTPVGQGIAGFTKEEIESVMPKLPKNIIKINW